MASRKHTKRKAQGLFLLLALGLTLNKNKILDATEQASPNAIETVFYAKKYALLSANHEKHHLYELKQ